MHTHSIAPRSAAYEGVEKSPEPRIVYLQSEYLECRRIALAQIAAGDVLAEIDASREWQRTSPCKQVINEQAKADEPRRPPTPPVAAKQTASDGQDVGYP